MRDLAAGLTDEALQHPVGEHWTVAITLAHLAWWDGRVSYVLDMTERNGALSVPQIDLIVNDLALPFWAAIPPRSRAACHRSRGNAGRAVGKLPAGAIGGDLCL